MARKNPPIALTIEVPVTRKTMDRIVALSVENITAYPDEVREAAMINASSISVMLANDAQFIRTVSRRLVDAAQDGISEAIAFGDIQHDTHPMVKRAVGICEKVAGAMVDEIESRERDRRVKDAIGLLKEAGYKVTKA